MSLSECAQGKCVGAYGAKVLMTCAAPMAITNMQSPFSPCVIMSSSARNWVGSMHPASIERSSASITLNRGTCETRETIEETNNDRSVG